MNRTELANKAAARAGFRQLDARELTEAIFEVIVDSVRRGEPVAIPLFGVFATIVRKRPSTFRNPRTGEKIADNYGGGQIRMLRFKPSKALKDVFNKPPAEWKKKHRRLMQMEEML